MPCKAPDVWTLDAQSWFARLGREPPADGAAWWQRVALVAAGDVVVCTLRAGRVTVYGRPLDFARVQGDRLDRLQRQKKEEEYIFFYFCLRIREEEN